MEKSIASPNEAEISQILGIDYGKSRVGLALADSETKMAFVLTTLLNDKNLLSNLAKIITEKNVKKIIIGVPAYVNKAEVEYDGERLGKLIKNVFTEMEIAYQDEMFTTKMAQDNLIAKGARGIKRFDDQEAAKIILQSWLDRP